MNRKHLVAVLLAVALFLGIAVVRAERPRQVTMVRINPDNFINKPTVTIPSGRVLGFSCTIEGPREMCYALVEGAK
jgi:hypothetical protein